MKESEKQRDGKHVELMLIQCCVPAGISQLQSIEVVSYVANVYTVLTWESCWTVY